MIETRKQHAAAEAIAQHAPWLAYADVDEARPLSTAELLQLALVALEAAAEVDA